MKRKLYHRSSRILLALLILVFQIKTYSQTGDFAFTKTKSNNKVLFNKNVGLPDISITGKVINENGEPMPGVNILLKGSAVGTTTDVNGNFSITVPDGNAVLIFSFIGYNSQEENVNNRSVLNISLTPDIKTLNEVIVTGYTSQEKRDITGAISTVSSKDLTAVPASNFAQQLQGRVAGVTVGNDGQPGGDVMVRIRGIGSITGSSDPLYIIDGVPTQGGLNQLNSNDIESMQILKDASAASIYGSRASNGVVIITTKQGKAGKTQVTFDTYTGFQQLTNRLPKFMNLPQLLDYTWKASRAFGNIDPATGNPIDSYLGRGAKPVVPDYIVYPGIGVNSNDPRADPKNYSIDNPIVKPNLDGADYWFKQLYHTAPITSMNLTVSGAGTNGKYALSASYFDQQGILRFTGFKRYSIRVNTEFNVSKKIRIGENLSLSYTDDVKTFRFDDNSPVAQVNTQFFQPVYDIAGNFTGSKMGNFYGNPYATLYRNKDNHTYNGRTFGNVYIAADILEGLTAKTSFGIDFTVNNGSYFNPSQPESRTAGPSSLNVTNGYGLNWIWTNTLTYTKTFGLHKFSLLAGSEAVKNKYRNFSTSKSNFAFDDLSYRYLDAGEKILTSSGSGSDFSLFSFFGKIDYSYNDKYLFSATLRRDASSRFAPNHRWGTFPAFSAGWRISQEDFLKDLTFINDLKLRASWGKTGNQEIDSYNQYSTYATSPASSSYDLTGSNNSLVTGYAPRKVGNPDAQWESQTMTNIGLDLSILNSKINLGVDVYNRTSDKLLLNVPHPATDGQLQFPAVNIGSMENKGIDVLIGYRNSALNGKFTYGISANWSTYKNKVTALYGGDDTFINGTDGLTRTAVGQPISSYYGYQLDGFFQSQAEADKYPTQGGNRPVLNQPGRWKFKNTNGDTVIDSKDQVFLGSAVPKFSYGLNINAGYAGFDLTVFIQGVYGNKLYNFQLNNTDFAGAASFPGIHLTDTWTPQNPNSTLPALNPNADTWERQTTTYFIENGSYIRGKNFQLGYSLPKNLLSKIMMSRARIYIQATNLFTITKYQGVDPEVNVRYQGNGSSLSNGVDRGVYPIGRTYMVGLQVGF